MAQREPASLASRNLFLPAWARLRPTNPVLKGKVGEVSDLRFCNWRKVLEVASSTVLF